MKFRRVTVWQINPPLSKTHFLCGGRLKFEQLDSTFVRVDTDEDNCGWGESCPWGQGYLPVPGHGVGNLGGFVELSALPGPGVQPEQQSPGSPVAIYGDAK